MGALRRQARGHSRRGTCRESRRLQQLEPTRWLHRSRDPVALSDLRRHPAQAAVPALTLADELGCRQLALWPEPRPKARRPPTRVDARGDEPRRTGFDLQGQFVCVELAAGATQRGASPCTRSPSATRLRPRREQSSWRPTQAPGSPARLPPGASRRQGACSRCCPVPAREPRSRCSRCARSRCQGTLTRDAGRLGSLFPSVGLTSTSLVVASTHA